MIPGVIKKFDLLILKFLTFQLVFGNLRVVGSKVNCELTFERVGY